MNFEQYVRGDKLSVHSSRYEKINMWELVDFLRSSPDIKHLEFQNDEDVKNLAEGLKYKTYRNSRSYSRA